MIHGLALIVEYLSRSYRRKIFSVFPSGLMAPVFILLVFAFSSFSWIFFRANSISDALMILRHILQQQPAGLNQYTGLWLKGFGISSLVISALATAGMLYVENILKADPGSAWTKPVREIVFCAVVLALIFVIGVFHRDSFIYAQF
jgi:alginate O-acetyltransferase complex protein AlgI